MNSITISGNLTSPPELKFLNSGTAAVRFRVAETKKGYDGREDKTSFLTCVAYGTLAQNIADSLDKGSRVVLTGRQEQRTWDDDKGNKHEVYEILVDECGPSLRFATCVVNKSERKTAKVAEEEYAF